MDVLILLQLNKAYKNYQNNTILETEKGFQVDIPYMTH